MLKVSKSARLMSRPRVSPRQADLKLLRACERLKAAEQERRRCNAPGSEISDEATAVACREWDDAVWCVIQTEACTAAGLRAKACALRTALFASPKFHNYPLCEERCVEDHFALALVEDTLAVLKAGAIRSKGSKGKTTFIAAAEMAWAHPA